MGCWDIFCFACGNPCHSLSSHYIEFIINLYKNNVNISDNTIKNSKLSSYDKELIKKIISDKDFFSKLKTLYKNSLWLNKCTFLTVDDRIIHGCKEIGCSIDFVDSKRNKYFHDFYNLINEIPTTKTNSGIFIHSDCWKYIKSTYKINLKYSDIPVIPNPKNFTKINPKINYGLIEKYWEQDFLFINTIFDSNEFMCESPFSNKKNESRIKKILSQFKINTDIKRTGPSVSATFYPESTYKIGIDKEIWEKKSGKWIKLKEPVEKISIKVDLNKLDKKLSNYFKKIVCIGEPSLTPLFISSMKPDKKLYLINFIGSENQIVQVKNYFN